ncbi:MAG: alpha-glucosidase/alpha-galactosidase [Defluviitaleaceae bacterium]|nr:alpha-glucosidase/alpha-galactosidase [Defluviitaleaceae bacterium]
MNKKVKIGYIGGGSMGWAWSVMKDLALEPALCGEVRLYDIDHESAKANVKIAAFLNNHEKTVVKWEYTNATTLGEALDGVDFVIISILPGTFDEMKSDVHAPEAYGIYQSVGDTTGPAGIVRSMRTVPMMAVIAEAIQRYCPEAWVINYTNPMAVCVGTLYKVFPKIKVFGCCHEAFHTLTLFQWMLEEETGGQIKKEDIRLNISGVNHFSWVDKASCGQTDLLPLFGKYADKYDAEGYSLWGGDRDPENYFRNLNMVCFDLYRRYGAIPAAGDRHIAEFLPWYLTNRESCEKWGFGLTPVSVRKKWQTELLAKRERILNGEESFEPNRSGEEGTKLIKALLGIEDMITNANIPNVGQAEGLPDGVIVETNAVFGRDSVRPVWAGRLPARAHLLVEKQARQQENLMRACMDKNIDLAFAVFLEDNLVRLDADKAWELFVRMLRNTQAYLTAWDIP